MDGWLNRHVQGPKEGHNWRLVRATLADGALSLRAAPQQVRAFDPTLVKPAPEPIDPEVLAAIQRDLRLLPYCVDDICAALRQLDPAVLAPAVRACLFPGLVLNEAVRAALQEASEVVARTDDVLATSLKREIYSAFAHASDLVPPAQAPEPSTSTEVRLHQLARVGHQLWLPPDLFCNPGFVEQLAAQLHLFHLQFWAKWSPLSDFTILFHRPSATSGSAQWILNPLVFDLKRPHFLGSLLLSHAFATTISEQTRGELLTSWARLGSELRARGDIVGWIAIAAVICTPAVLRLRAAWSHVPQKLRETVSREWGYEVFELEKRASLDFLEKQTFRASTEAMGELYSKQACVPYFGDVIVTNTPDCATAAAQLERLAAVTEGWIYYFDSARDAPGVTFVPPKANPFMQDLFFSYLKLNRENNPLPSATEQSFQIEPRAFGAYLPSFFTQLLPLTLGSHIPLLFTEPVPSFRLLSKSALASSASRPRGMGPISAPRLQRSNSFPPLTTGIREVENGPREYLTKHVSPHELVRAIRDLLNVGVSTHLVGMDLILKSLEESSRHSRHSSLLEATDRRSSVQSLELATHMQYMDLDTSVDVVVKAASLGRLVDTLVLGVGEFSTNRQRFKINLPAHTETFLATFRSFCSPLELLKMLKMRFFGAPAAAASIVAHRSGDPPSQPFPMWGHSDVPSQGQELRLVSQIYCNILEAVQYWITEFHVDFADDAELTKQMHNFLGEIEGPLVAFEALPAHARRLGDTFVKLRYRAPDLVPVNTLPPPSRHMVQLPPSQSLAQMEQFLEEIDSIVADHFSAVLTVDWMQLFETLELQVSDPMALFNYTPSATTSEDELPVQDIFSYFGSLYRTNSKDKTISYFPSTIKALFKLHANITQYFVYQITDPNLHVLKNRNRVTLCASVLKMLGILRVRMRFFDLFPNTDDVSTRVPSFLESAIVAAILRPESRCYAQAWLQAGLDVQTEFDAASHLPMGFSASAHPPGQPNSFTLFIPQIPPSKLKTRELQPITPCIGWIAERLFEIVCYIPNVATENAELINFDKRRYAYNLIKNLKSEFPSTMDAKLYNQYDYIVNPEASLFKIDKKAVKEAAAREAPKNKRRVFTGVISAELEKMRLEARQYDGLMRGAAASSHHHHHHQPTLSSSSSTTSIHMLEKRSLGRMRPMSIVSPGSSGSQDSRKTRSSRFGSLLKQTVRPLSMAFSSNNLSQLSSGGSSVSLGGSSTGGSGGGGGSIIDPSSLPELSSCDEKILVSMDLAVCEVKGPRKGGVFRVVSSRSELVLQAPSEQSAAEWVQALADACKRAVAEAQMRPGSTRVFGVPLEIVCRRENSLLPTFLEALLQRVEQFGLDEVGIYRISGSLSAVNALKACLDNGERLNLSDSRWLDMNVVAGCVKLYLRELPEALLAPTFEELIQCANCPKERQLKMLFDCIAKLPTNNYHLLKRIIQHLNLVVQHEATNKMSTPNLAIVFSMNFFPTNAMDRMRPMQSVVNTMIVNQNYLFGGSDESF